MPLPVAGDFSQWRTRWQCCGGWVALWSEYKRISWYSVPREVTARFMALPEPAGPTLFGTEKIIRHEFKAAGFLIT